MAPSPELIEQILEQLSVMTVDVEELTGATANFVRLNRTDFHALQVLSSSRGMTAGELARALRVTTGATTRVIDSLVAAGHARREWDPEDRRRILVALLQQVIRLAEEVGEEVGVYQLLEVLEAVGLVLGSQGGQDAS